MENNLAPKVACMHPLGRSKTIEQCNRNEYAEGDLMLGKVLARRVFSRPMDAHF